MRSQFEGLRMEHEREKLKLEKTSSLTSKQLEEDLQQGKKKKKKKKKIWNFFFFQHVMN